MSAKIVDIQGKAVTPEPEKPKARTFIFYLDDANSTKIEVSGFLFVNPVFISVANESNEVIFAVGIDRLFFMHSSDISIS